MRIEWTLLCCYSCTAKFSALGLSLSLYCMSNDSDFSHPHWDFSQEKNSININFSVRISRGHSWPLRPDAPGSKSFSPSLGPQENALFGADVHDFRRGRPWPEGFSKNFVQKKFALIFWPLFSIAHHNLISRLGGPVLRAIARPSQRYPLFSAMGFWCLN